MTDSMFMLCGQVAKVFQQPGGVSKRTGEAFDARDKVQIMGELPLPNGQSRFELITLGADDASQFEQFIGKMIRVPVGFFSLGKSISYFVPKGAKVIGVI